MVPLGDAEAGLCQAPGHLPFKAGPTGIRHVGIEAEGGDFRVIHQRGQGETLELLRCDVGIDLQHAAQGGKCLLVYQQAIANALLEGLCILGQARLLGILLPVRRGVDGNTDEQQGQGHGQGHLAQP